MSRTIPMMKLVPFFIIATLMCWPGWVNANPYQWALDFPNTDLSRFSVDLSEIRSVGAERDSIPAIVSPKFASANSVSDLGQLEPILRVEVDGEVRGYPLRILLWHELVNDTINDTPVLITYCPLCSSGVVFDRRIDGEALMFKNTGLLRHYDTVIYDDVTESWWQQFSGDALAGSMSGKRLKAIPSRIQPFQQFVAENPDSKLLVPEDAEAWEYGKTPYVRMDSRNDAAAQFPYAIPEGILPLDRVVVIGNAAWPLNRLRVKNRIETEAVILTWSAGMNSVHDTRWIPFGRDIGGVQAWVKTDTGIMDAVHDTTFAFAFAAFRPNGTWHLE